MTTIIELGNERLLNVAQACEEAVDENFNMDKFHNCGTPGCALGHYAARADLQGEFELTGLIGLRSKSRCTNVGFNHSFVLDHFAISESQAFDLFSPFGCDEANTDKMKAAAYIRDFVARRTVK